MSRVEKLREVLGEDWFERFCGLSLYRKNSGGVERCTVWWMDGMRWASTGPAGAPDADSTNPLVPVGDCKDSVWDELAWMVRDGWSTAQEAESEGRVAFRVMKRPRGNGVCVLRHNPDGTKRCEIVLDTPYPSCYDAAYQIVGVLKKHEKRNQ